MIVAELMPERRCFDCSAKKKEEWGCTTDAALPLEFDGQQTYRCPARVFLDHGQFIGACFDAYRNYNKGFLPYDGGTGSQPNKLMQAIGVIDSALSEVAAERRVEPAQTPQGRAKGPPPGMPTKTTRPPPRDL